MKDCKAIHPLLSLDLEGVLSKKEKALVEKHLAVCITARCEKEQFERMRKALQDQPEPPVPADLHERIMSRLGLAAQETPKVIPWKRPFLLAAAMLLVVVFMDRLPEWKADALRPDPESFAPQPKGSSMEQEVPAERMEGLRQARRDKARKKKETRAVEKKAPPVHQPASMERALGKDAEKDSGALGMAAADSMMEDKAEEAPGLPPSTAPAAKSAAAPAPATSSFSGVEGATQPTEAERTQEKLNTLSLSKEVTGKFWKGQGGEEKERQELITDGESFRKYWSALGKGPVPVVDFSTEAVVLFFTGTQTNPPPWAKITRMEERDGTLRIYHRLEQRKDSFTFFDFTTAWSMQVIPKPIQPVVFVKEE